MMATTVGELSHAAAFLCIPGYLRKNGVTNMFSGIIEQLLTHKPANPVQFTIDHLMKIYPDQVVAGGKQAPIVEVLEELSDDESDEEDDEIVALKKLPKYANKINRRCSVSASSDLEKSLRAAKHFPVHAKSAGERDFIRSLLRQYTTLFGGLGKKNASIVVDAMEKQVHKKDKAIIEEGDREAPFCYFVAEGELTVTKKDPQPGDSGREIEVYRCQKGDAFGELALLYNAPRAASVKSLTPCTLWALDANTFAQIVAVTSQERHGRLVEFLNKVPILASLDPGERNRLVDCLEETQWRENEVVITQGEEGDKFFIVEDGIFACFVNGEEVCRLDAGAYFGEVSLLTKKRRQATVKAVGDGANVTLAVDRKTFQRVLGPLSEVLKRNVNHYLQVMHGHHM